MSARAAGRARIVPLATLMVLAVAGCAAFTPTTEPATPTDFAGIVAELQGEGIDVNRVVSGDAGCKDQSVYDELRPAVDACARSYVTDAAAFGSVDAPPYVLAGNGPWTPAFKNA